MKRLGELGGEVDNWEKLNGSLDPRVNLLIHKFRMTQCEFRNQKFV